LVEYFELNITNNQSDEFLRMLSKNDLPFSYGNLKKSYLVDLKKDLRKSYNELRKKSYENLTKI